MRRDGRAQLSCRLRPWQSAPARQQSASTSSSRADVQAAQTTASRLDPTVAPREISANRQCLPKKESRSQSGRCAHRAASSRTYCRPDKKEGRKKIRATTLLAFLAGGNRRSGAFVGSRFNSVREPDKTQRSRHQILSMLTLCGLSANHSGAGRGLRCGGLFHPGNHTVGSASPDTWIKPQAPERTRCWLVSRGKLTSIFPLNISRGLYATLGSTTE